MNGILQCVAFGSGFLYLVKCTWGLSMLLSESTFHWYSFWISYRFMNAPQFLSIQALRDIYAVSSFSSYEQSSCKHLHAGFCVNVSFQFTWWTRKSVIAGSYGKSMFNFIRNCQTPPEWPYQFASHQQWMRVPLFLNPLEHSVFSVFWILAVMIGVWWYCIALFFFKVLKKFYLFIYFWLRWVFVAAPGLSLVAVSGGYSSLGYTGFSLRWLLLLQSTTGSRRVGFSSCGSRALERRLSSCGSRA